MLAVLERRPKVVTEIGGCSEVEDMHSHSLTHSIWSHPLLTHPLSLSIPDTCRCRSTWWGEIVNDASHRKSGSPGHATPSPCELLFNWALFMKLDVAQNQTCKPAARFPSTSAGINRGKQKKGNRSNRVEFGWKEIFPRICTFILSLLNFLHSYSLVSIIRKYICAIKFPSGIEIN